MNLLSLRNKNNILYVLAYSRNESWLLTFNSHGFKVELNNPEDVINKLIIVSKTCNTTILPDFDYKKSFKDLYTKWGYSSLTKFNEGIKEISIEFSDKKTEIFPSENMWIKKGLYIKFKT
jgi:hypothetical protein